MSNVIPFSRPKHRRDSRPQRAEVPEQDTPQPEGTGRIQSPLDSDPWHGIPVASSSGWIQVPPPDLSPELRLLVDPRYLDEESSSPS